MRLIEFCVNNMHYGTDEVMRRLEERPDAETLEYGCLSFCDQCAMEPYALVDGEVVRAETADELYEKIVNMLEEELLDPFADLDLD